MLIESKNRKLAASLIAAARWLSLSASTPSSGSQTPPSCSEANKKRKDSPAPHPGDGTAHVASPAKSAAVSPPPSTNGGSSTPAAAHFGGISSAWNPSSNESGGGGDDYGADFGADGFGRPDKEDEVFLRPNKWSGMIMAVDSTRGTHETIWKKAEEIEYLKIGRKKSAPLKLRL
jgi:hypothetical protein